MPRIGLLSDSHGRADTTRQAVKLLMSQSPDVLIHLGDVGTVEVLDELVLPATDGEAPMPVHVVFGNTDWDTAGLGKYAVHIGLRLAHPVGRLSFGGRELVFAHGHDPEPLREAIDRQVAWICHGHTHKRCDHREEQTRIINPGALFRASTYSVALLETDADSLAFFSLDAR